GGLDGGGGAGAGEEALHDQRGGLRLLCRNGQLFAATVDHKPFREDEEARIKAAGGFVVHKRVMGELAVSRAFGDSEFKRGLFTNTDKDTSNNGVLITCEPEILEYDLTPEDHFILLACDGLFDVFENEEAVALVLQEMAGHRNAHRACEALSRRAARARVPGQHHRRAARAQRVVVTRPRPRRRWRWRWGALLRFPH
ncbi:unnamed protein product, partial [Heterosigma akashiwo]